MAEQPSLPPTPGSSVSRASSVSSSTSTDFDTIRGNHSVAEFVAEIEGIIGHPVVVLTTGERGLMIYMRNLEPPIVATNVKMEPAVGECEVRDAQEARNRSAANRASGRKRVSPKSAKRQDDNIYFLAICEDGHSYNVSLSNLFISETAERDAERLQKQKVLVAPTGISAALEVADPSPRPFARPESDKGYGIALSNAETAHNRFQARQRLIDRRVKLCNWSVYVALAGLAIAIIDVEIQVGGYGSISQSFHLSTALRLVVLTLTIFLDALIIGHHVTEDQDSSTRAIASFNHVLVDLPFVLKTMLCERPLTLIAISGGVFWTSMTWVVTQCERYATDNSMSNAYYFFDYAWFEAVTFFAIGFGDIEMVTYCGRSAAILTGLVGTITSSLITVLVSQRMLLSLAERRVNQVVAESHLTNLDEEDDYITVKRAFAETEDRLRDIRNRQKQLGIHLANLSRIIDALSCVFVQKYGLKQTTVQIGQLTREVSMTTIASADTDADQS
ncbi:calcium-activated SK potassium channel domain-containing protein [Ditylenchus destructor]|nr:calcium-activated SK potassium channel domain-containing protein [Ditylenchus destructor]